VTLLTEAMHAAVPGSLVVWYDAMTVNGEVKWQCRVNELNKPFFDCCGAW
jgi:mannosyl-glycoprotein endo-beta-N-acetylglucosaminidase